MFGQGTRRSPRAAGTRAPKPSDVHYLTSLIVRLFQQQYSVKIQVEPDKRSHHLVEETDIDVFHVWCCSNGVGRYSSQGKRSTNPDFVWLQTGNAKPMTGSCSE